MSTDAQVVKAKSFILKERGNNTPRDIPFTVSNGSNLITCVVRTCVPTSLPSLSPSDRQIMFAHIYDLSQDKYSDVTHPKTGKKSRVKVFQSNWILEPVAEAVKTVIEFEGSDEVEEESEEGLPQGVIPQD